MALGVLNCQGKSAARMKSLSRQRDIASRDKPQGSAEVPYAVWISGNSPRLESGESAPRQRGGCSRSCPNVDSASVPLTG